MKLGPIVPHEAKHCILIDYYLWITILGVYDCWRDECYKLGYTWILF